jgi:hypothetical protein
MRYFKLLSMVVTTCLTTNDSQLKKISAQEKPDIPENAMIIDGHGLYLMPGLVDAHVHCFDATVFGRLMIANAVLLIRDMGMPNGYILPLRDQLNGARSWDQKWWLWGPTGWTCTSWPNTVTALTHDHTQDLPPNNSTKPGLNAYNLRGRNLPIS